VEYGDFNWITQHFIAFASPVEPGFTARIKAAKRGTIASSPPLPSSDSLPPTFSEVLSYFTSHKVGLVVRLNHALYEKRNFVDLDIDHVEMPFPDGTCPDMAIVKDFIALADTYIDNECMRSPWLFLCF
jgi:cell division cycle 14